MMGTMTIVEEPGVSAETSSVFGDEFVWFPDDSEPCRYDPVTDVRVRSEGEPKVTPEWIAAVVEHAVAAIEMLDRLDTADLDAASVTAWGQGVERIRREADSAAVAVADHVDVAQPFKGDGFFTAKNWLQHTLQLSGAEARGRVQAARFRRRVPMWGTAEGAGQIGVAQMSLMARIAANPRIDDQAVQGGAWALLVDAMEEPFERFERLARTWESLADPVGAATRAERNREQRDAMLHFGDDDAWMLHAKLDAIAGAEFEAIFAHYIDAEFRSDWDEAVERLGEGNVTVQSLRRREPHRRADALAAVARAAAAAPPDARRPVPTVNVLVDVATLEAGITGQPISPDAYRDVTCRTERGHPLPRDDVAVTTLWGMIRRVVYDSAGVVVDLGRRSRLFTGSARDAVMLLEPDCIWTGCTMPNSWCHADHTQGWNSGGRTDSNNGGPLCARHNHLKEQGYTVQRDSDAVWHVFHPDGHEIL